MPLSQIASRVAARLTGAWRTLSVLAVATASVPLITITDGATAKTPGKTYCFRGTCHRVLTLAQTRRQIGSTRSVLASYYRSCRVDRYNPCGLTSSGTVFRPSRADNAASPIYPNGTKLLVWNPSNERAVVVRIDNAGPYWGGRTLDLSRAAADRLGFRHRGVARLKVSVLAAPTRSEARYRARRIYAPVRGYIGRFASLSMAIAAGGGRVSTGQTQLAQFSKKTSPKSKPPLPAVLAAKTGNLNKSSTNRLPPAVIREEPLATKSVKRQRVAALSRKSAAQTIRGAKRTKRIKLKLRATGSRLRKPAQRRLAATTPKPDRRKAIKFRHVKLASLRSKIERRRPRQSTKLNKVRSKQTRRLALAKRGPTAKSKYKSSAAIKLASTRKQATRRVTAPRVATPTPKAVVVQPNKQWRNKYFSPGGSNT
jgi:rare lipoprotein A